MQLIPTPKAVLFDLFHTLTMVPAPEIAGEIPVSEILGVSSDEWHRLYYDDDVLGRCIGRIHDSVEAMRRITHTLDPNVDELRIMAAVESRRRRFAKALTEVNRPVLEALDRLRGAGIRTALVSDAGADDVESWHESPLRSRLDAAVFSYQLGIRKPDSRIYHHALERIGVAPQDALFVGDGGSNEHRGARAVGMKAVLVTSMVSARARHRIPEIRRYADWEFQDVPAFVSALKLGAATAR